MNDAKTLSEAAKPEKFKENTKLEDWKPTFLNYIRSISGRDGVPLKYICRTNDEPDPTPHNNFLDDYVAMAPLNGNSYAIDTVQVHTFLVNFVSETTQPKRRFKVYCVQMMDVTHSSDSSKIMKASVSMQFIFAKRTRLSRACSTPVRNHHTYGGPSLKNDSHEPSMHT